MIVVGVDPHKATNTAVALDAGTGQLRDELTVAARAQGDERLLVWARSLGRERIWAMEDCRHVSGRLERFLLRRGERVVRVPPKLMAGARRSTRSFGKSDSIDALAVARAALREPDLGAAQLAGVEREIALLLDHREDLVASAPGSRTACAGTCTTSILSSRPSSARSSRLVTLRALARRLARAQQSTEVRIARELVARCAELTRRANELQRELRVRVERHAPQLLGLPGCGVLTAAKLVAEIAGVERFRSDAKLAMLAGVAPLDASSGRQLRHRLNRKGNRQLNRALHTIAKAQARHYAPAREYLARRTSEGKTRREALRALKRHLARVVFKLLNSLRHPDKMATMIKLGRAPAAPCLT